MDDNSSTTLKKEILRLKQREYYKKRIQSMNKEELEKFRRKQREANRRFYNGRKQDHEIVLLLKSEILN